MPVSIINLTGGQFGAEWLVNLNALLAVASLYIWLFILA